MKINGTFYRSVQSFNMTPVIDIVFQLIIFFSLVCRFIEAENFPITVPDNCRYAQGDSQQNTQAATVTVMKTSDDKIDFAVGSEVVEASSYADAAEKLARLIDVRLKDLPAERRVVNLRIDKDICFAQAQYALASVAASSAVNVQLAALKDRRPISD